MRDADQELFRIWDELAERRALPEELYVVELGVGNGSQARTWLDAFVELDRARGRDYYRRLHYLMCDYSPHVLELARAAVAEHAERVSSFVLDATRPTDGAGLPALQGRSWSTSPTSTTTCPPTRSPRSGSAHLPGRDPRLPAGRRAPRRSPRASARDRRRCRAWSRKLLRLGPELLAEAAPQHFPDVDAAVALLAARLGRRCGCRSGTCRCEGLDTYEVAPGVSGELLRPMLEPSGDVRMHVSNGAAASFAETLPLLHPYGRLQCHDLFVTDIHQYRTGFRGPGKYDGSVVNWVNGPLLAHIGAPPGLRRARSRRSRTAPAATS